MSPPAAVIDRPIDQTCARACALVALASLATFCASALALHGLRPDLDPAHSQMSLYLIGDWGPLLQAAYVVLAIGMTALGWGLRQASSGACRSAAPLLLFALGGLSLATTAYAWMDLPGIDSTLEGLIHGVSAQGAFLFATAGMVLQALRLRGDAAWRVTARWALPWALLCFASIWVLALWRDAPRGLAQKTVVVLILGWLAAVSTALWRCAAASRGGACSRQPHRPGHRLRSADATNATSCNYRRMENDMIKWAIIFAVIGLIAGALGFTGVAGASMGIAKFLFWAAIIIAVVLFVLGLTVAKKVTS